MKQLITLSLIILSFAVVQSQQLEVEGNGLFISPASTHVDINSINENTSSLVRFGDHSTAKSSLGYNGNEDVFKISMGSTLAKNDFTLSPIGHVGINTLPSAHRLQINHNSSAGSSGSAHLLLRENQNTGFSRIRFENNNATGWWTIASRATDDMARMNFFYNSGSESANIMTLDGDNFRVGILKTNPEAYLHIKEHDSSVPALILENDDQTGGEKWTIKVGSDDLEFYFQGDLRGAIDDVTGEYMAMPAPPPAIQIRSSVEPKVLLSDILKINLYKIDDGSNRLALDFKEVDDINPAWIVHSEDGSRMGINSSQLSLAVMCAFKAQQDATHQQSKVLLKLREKDQELAEQMRLINEKMDRSLLKSQTN